MLIDVGGVKLTNKLNAIDDPAPGASLASPSGSIVQSYKGQVGAQFALDDKLASELSDTSVATLYGGIYQYVLFKAGTTASNARGQVVFWDDREAAQVTPDAAATNVGKVAGITLNAVTKGQYGVIQIAGKAGIKFKATVTKATPADGDLVIVDQTPANLGDVLADATQLTSVTAKCVLGVALEAPVGGSVKLIDLWELRKVF